MTIKSNKFNAVKTVVDKITFDSKFESEVYQELKSTVGREKIRHHHRIPFLGKRNNSRLYCIRDMHWRVDFMIKNDTDQFAFGVEAKGKFMPADKFKFLLWEIYQEIPLIVVHSADETPRGFRSNRLKTLEKKMKTGKLSGKQRSSK